MSLLSIFISLFIISPFSNELAVKTYNTFDKKAYYATFASNDVNSVNTELKVLKSNTELLAYEGALLMKKAGLVGNPKDKLSFMKQGKNKLEVAISKNPTNVEYCFLRYMIQDNAPGFLGYNTNLAEDRKKIISNYKNFDPIVKDAIANYSKISKTLSSAQF
jgi:hypothetical protein